MTTLVKADDQGRILIRGTEEGRQYRVTKENGGWWVALAHGGRPPKKRREWTGPAKDLSRHLQEMADLGFTLEPSEISKQKVGPCRFQDYGCIGDVRKVGVRGVVTLTRPMEAR